MKNLKILLSTGIALAIAAQALLIVVYSEPEHPKIVSEPEHPKIVSEPEHPKIV
ncbi:hypothetical protein SLL00_13740 [Metabacillus indicus]|uniref:hypothetical protein n=1 Tax=Metabacillus indicus TaxID=246786 RepID=UPI002A029F2B|nr:hypothetical protein [Metabacillus indicus]MDX8290869.1 hypothetical protein [Metabacillus indicus]